MKKIILAACCAALTLGLAGCVSTSAENNATPAPTTAAPAPTISATTLPPMTSAPTRDVTTPTLEPSAPGGAVVGGAMTEGTVAPGATGTNGNAVMGVGDASQLGERISDEIERLSEIDDAETVVRGDTAVVAVRFDDQYKGGMTTRIQDMVTTRVQNVDKNIKTVHVTNDENLYTTVDDLAERLEKGTISVMDEIGKEFETLISKIVPGA